VATIALLCVSNSVPAHDIYSSLRDRNGHLCCNGQDCRPVEATVLPNGNYYLPASDEIVPADMAAPSPDNRFHHCTHYPVANEFDRWGGPVWEDKPKTRCFFAPHALFVVQGGKGHTIVCGSQRLPNQSRLDGLSHHAQTPAVLDHSRTLPQGDGSPPASVGRRPFITAGVPGIVKGCI